MTRNETVLIEDDRFRRHFEKHTHKKFVQKVINFVKFNIRQSLGHNYILGSEFYIGSS